MVKRIKKPKSKEKQIIDKLIALLIKKGIIKKEELKL